MKKIIDSSILEQSFDIYERKYKMYYYYDKYNDIDYPLDSKITSWTYKCTLTGEELLYFLNWNSFDTRINETLQIRRYNSHIILSKSTIIDYFYQFQYRPTHHSHKNSYSYRHIKKYNYRKQKLSQREINHLKNDYSFAHISLKNNRIQDENYGYYNYKLRHNSRCWKENCKNRKQYMRHF